MIIDIRDLKNKDIKSIEINENVSFEKERLNSANIIDTKDLTVSGYINIDINNEIELDLVVNGVLVLPSSLTLEPTEFPINVEIKGNYAEMMSEIEDFDKNIENSLDILPIIWENILVEIPIKVTGPEATNLKLSGDGWKLVTKESELKENSAFDKLKDLL